jgi:D-arabinose 1-dehydrogenase-like Zn-dependent alcohol dehydrogenase
MKVAHFYEVNEPLKLEEVSIPKIGAQEALVRIKASGVCASDLHYYHGKLSFGKIPITMGHECTGMVEEVGSGVKELMRGERVCIHYVISCGNCYFCCTGRDNLRVNAKFIGFVEGWRVCRVHTRASAECCKTTQRNSI